MAPHKLFYHALPRLGWLYLQLVGKTSKILWINQEVAENLDRKNENYIYAFWHGRQVFFTYSHRYRPICALVSQSKDGELMAQMICLFGMRTARGSNFRGARQGLLELIHIAQNGFHPAFTPDGPRGPARTVQPGVLYLAKKLGVPIIPIANGMKRYWQIKNSWDEYLVPLPFNQVSIVYGNPLWVTESESREAATEKLRKELNRVSELADQIAQAD